MPEWADRFRQLAKEAGSTSGQWRTSTVEIARGPMLAVTEPGVHIITAMVATQLLKTALLENVTGFHAHLDPNDLTWARYIADKDVAVAEDLAAEDPAQAEPEAAPAEEPAE